MEVILCLGYSKKYFINMYNIIILIFINKVLFLGGIVGKFLFKMSLMWKRFFLYGVLVIK